MTINKEKLRPWLIWGLGAGFFLLQYIIRISPSVMRAELMRDFVMTGYAFGILAALFYYAYIFMQIPVGLLLDRYGSRFLLAGAALVVVIGGVLFATAHNVSQAEAARLLMGIGSSFSFIGGIKLAAIWLDPRYFGMLAGATQGLGMLGAACGNSIVAKAITILGWRATIWLLTGLFMLLATAIFFIVRNRPQPVSHHHQAELRKMPLRESIILVCKQSQTWINAVYVGVMYAPITAFAALWGVSFLEVDYGISRATAAMAVGAIFLGWGMGSPILGLVSDKILRRKPVMIFSSITCILLLSVVLYVSLPVYLMFGLLFGYGVVASGGTVAYAHASELHGKAIAGMAVAIANMASIIVGAACQPAIGRLLDVFWDGKIVAGVRVYSAADYKMALTLLIILLLIGVVVAFLLKETFCGGENYAK